MNFSRSINSSTFLFQFIISFTFGQQLRKTIKLMFFPKSHVLFAEEGRPVGPIDWWCAMIKMTMHAMARLKVKWHQVGFWGVPGERDSRVALGTPTTYHLLLLAQWYVVKPSDEIGSYVSAIFSSWSLGEKNVVCLLRSSMTLTCIFAWMCYNNNHHYFTLNIFPYFPPIITIVTTYSLFVISFMKYFVIIITTLWSFCITFILLTSYYSTLLLTLYIILHNEQSTI